MKILIVGGGPAGLAAAHHLLKAGKQVTLAEQARRPLDKVCGEGIMPLGVQLLRDLGLVDRVLEAGRPFRGIAYEHGKRRVVGQFPDGLFGIGIHRGRLNQIMRDACMANPNFQMRMGQRIDPDKATNHHRILAADGIHSRFRGKGDVPIKRSPRLGLRFRLQIKPPDHVTVRFLRGAEIYQTPTGGQECSVAMLVHPKEAGIAGGNLKDWCIAQFNNAYPQYAELPKLDLATRGPIAARGPAKHSEIHLLGDALRAFDPITGAGMSWALLCAAQAAKHLDDTAAYYQSLKPAAASIGRLTDLVLLLRGGGRLTGLMMRQLEQSPKSFEAMLALHNGKSLPHQLPLKAALGLLKPFRLNPGRNLYRAENPPYIHTR